MERLISLLGTGKSTEPVTGISLRSPGGRKGDPLPVTGYRLPVTGYRLPVTGYRLLVTGSPICYTLPLMTAPGPLADPSVAGLLDRLVASPEAELEWIDLLSQLEYVGCRKIVKSVGFE